ncbi:hypothetical protein NO1_0057 [Candidatus Termititenax aidoneus]|uniref:Uncharacterized protein n=1 Tax=Termititenax aidoneus TaxID=2218524 RepID=A0A388T7B1_TERA1|nr:hypothetical protein NO1_0057 [Candidatus Termititenax aidoneus]
MRTFSPKLINFTDPHDPAALADMLQNYAFFKPRVERLRKELAGVSNYKKHPAFLAVGRTVRVFVLQADGESYAVRLLGTDHEQQHFRARLCGGSLVSDLPGLEKIIAASLEDGVTVSRLSPGRNISKLTNEDLSAISPEQLNGFVDSLTQAYRRGVLVDTSAGNLFYDRTLGFSIIDYISVNGLSYGLGYLTAEVARQFRFDFERSVCGAPDAVITPAELRNFFTLKINILKTYAQAAGAKLPPKDFEIVKKAAAKILSALKRAARRCGVRQ